MKTAEEISQKWVGWEFGGLHLPKRKELESEIEEYASQFKVVSPEPTEEEIKEESWLRLNSDAKYSAYLTWIESINWYKNKTGRS